jgi:hypothetical protein
MVEAVAIFEKNVNVPEWSTKKNHDSDTLNEATIEIKAEL